MGLETGTYISDLTPTWPTGSESKSQGDDHLRLIKSVLKNTLPTATKPFYFPTVEETTASLVLDATDQNNVIELDTTATTLTITLPSTLTAADKGWQCTIVKVSTDANAVIVSPSAGTILTKVGAVATVRVGILCEPATFVWNGTGWRCYKPGPMIGTSEEFNGSSLPPGYLWETGGTFVAAQFAELYKALGNSNTIFDKRGRVSATLDNLSGVAAGRIVNDLTNGVAGTTLGGTGGSDRHQLLQAQLPNFTPTVSSYNLTYSDSRALYSSLSITDPGDGSATVAIGNTTDAGQAVGGTISMNSIGSNNAHNNMQPTIMVSRILRAC